jgi:hypothetical protein
MGFNSEPSYRHGTVGKVGVILANPGHPERTNA